MTEMLQKNENVAKNVANENSQDLTEQWKKGELFEGFYYVKCDWSDEVEIRYVHNGVDDWKEIVAEVPSYDEWEKAYECVVSENEEITTLKELLKEWVQFEIEENPNDFTVMSERMSELANKTKEVLK